MTDTDRYVPAAGRAAFTRLYDPVMALSMRESSWRQPFSERVGRDLPEGGVVADIGAGTGTFAIDLANNRCDAIVIAVDGDPQSIGLAQSKTGSERVRWTKGLATKLPLSDASVDVVSLSLLLHHLSSDAKRQALAEARRILRSEGHLHVADWGRPDSVTFVGFQFLRLLDGLANTSEHAQGSIAMLIDSAGFEDATVWRRLRTFWGSTEFIVARV
ncbi:MAG: class I SAM-dependent methyltransferase [Thermoleophilia bacterium]|nr:class I SAM-dependent methyltransferase [Thermoleophilia bacterium]